MTCDGKAALVVSAAFHNVGISRILLAPETIAYIYSVSSDTWPYLANIHWSNQITVARLFERDSEVDGQESATDEILVPLTTVSEPGPTPVAYRIECRVAAARPKHWPRSWLYRKPLLWFANVIIPAVEESPSEKEHRDDLSQ